jgi:type I restriction enzyme, S subunit
MTNFSEKNLNSGACAGGPQGERRESARKRYQAYPEYKDSGLDGLGSIPRDWKIMQLKRSVTSCVNGIWGAEPNNDGLDTIVIRVADFDRQRLSINDDGFTFRKIEEKEKIGRLLRRGDLLLEKSGGGEKTLVGQVVLFDKDFDAVTSNFVAKMTPNEGFESRYLNYVFCRFYSQNINFCSIKQNTGIQNLDSASYLSEEFGFPSFGEQQKIANFLDHETAKIDTLIEKQQQLIQLLKEKRQAVISHVVTKGLNPNALMKDSGVEWLGEVPEHWVVTRLKYHTNLFEQGWSPQCDARPAEGDEYGVLKVGCVNQGVFNCVENKALPKELEPQLQYLLKKDDLLISRANTKELVGSAAVVDGDYDNLLLCDKLYRIRFDHLIVPQLVAYYLALPIVRQQIELEASGASHSMQNIGQSTIKELPIVIPPRDEADELIIKIQEKMDIFNSIHKRASDQIQLLQERRTALISAAVTGKIDVRHFVSEDGQLTNPTRREPRHEQ